MCDHRFLRPGLSLCSLALTCAIAITGSGDPLAGRARALEPPAKVERTARTVELIPDAGHVNTVLAIVYSPDGKTFASAGADGTVKLWDARAANLIRTYIGPGSPLVSVAFTPNGRSIAAASSAGTAIVWDTASGSELLRTEPQDAASAGAQGNAAAIHPLDSSGESLLLAVCKGNSVSLLQVSAAVDPETHRSEPLVKPVASLSGHNAPVLSLAISPDGKTVATGCTDGTVKTWDTADGGLQYTFAGHSMPVRALCFSGNGTTLADGSDDGDSRRWDLRTGKRIGDRLHHKAPGDGHADPGIRVVALTADGLTAATGGGKSLDDRHGYAAMWDTRSEKATHAEIGHADIVEAAAFSPDGENLVTGGRDHTVRLWDVRTGSGFAVGGDTQSIPSAAVSPTSDLLATGSADSAVRLWSARTGQLVRVLKGHKGAVRAVAFAPTGPFLASGGLDGAVRIWNTDTGAKVRSWETDSSEVESIAFSPDGTVVASGLSLPGGHGAIELRAFADGRLLRTLAERGPGTIHSLSFSPDGAQLAAGTGGYRVATVTIWDIATGSIKRESIIDASLAARAVAYSTDGSILVAAVDRVARTDTGLRRFADIRVYNGRTGAQQRVFDIAASADRVQSLTVAGDNRTIYAGTTGGSISAFDARTGECVRTFDPAHRGPICALCLPHGDKFIASAGLDNTLRLWRPDTGKLIMTLLPVNSEAAHGGVTPIPTSDWLAAVPQGYYTGSADAARSVHWQVGPNQYSVDAFEKALHRPEMLRKALNGEALLEAQPGRRFQDGAAPPEILFTSPTDGQRVSGDKLKVEGYVADPDQVLQMEVLVNGRVAAAKPIALDSRGKPIALDSRGKPIALDSRGKPIALDSRGKPIALDSRGKPIALDSRGKRLDVSHASYQRFQCEVSLPPGEDRMTIAAVAYNGAMLAAREEVHVSRSESGPAGRLYVLAVGINRYQNTKYNLRFARQDAEAFAEIWKGKSGSLYTSVDTTVLLDNRATTTTLRAALFRLQEQATDRDSVVIFLSGHGVEDGDKYYFATHEIEATRARIGETSLPWTALQTALSGIRARRVALFLDACHSGSALGPMQANTDRLSELLVKQSGVVVYASCRGSEVSYELEDKMHGAFTAALIEGLGDGKANLVINGRRSGAITAEDLLAYLRRRVPELSDQRQTPSCPLLRDFGDAFPIAGAK